MKQRLSTWLVLASAATFALVIWLSLIGAEQLPTVPSLEFSAANSFHRTATRPTIQMPVEPGAEAPREFADDGTGLEASSDIPSAESAAEYELRTFRNALLEFKGVVVEKPDWPGMSRDQIAHPLLAASISAALDAQGRAIERLPGVKSRPPARQTGLVHNGKLYYFEKGEFPAWDGYEAHRARLREEGRNRRELDGAPLVLSDDLAQQIATFAEECLAIREIVSF